MSKVTELLSGTLSPRESVSGIWAVNSHLFTRLNQSSFTARASSHFREVLRVPEVPGLATHLSRSKPCTSDLSLAPPQSPAQPNSACGSFLLRFPIPMNWPMRNRGAGLTHEGSRLGVRQHGAVGAGRRVPVHRAATPQQQPWPARSMFPDTLKIQTFM